MTRTDLHSISLRRGCALGVIALLLFGACRDDAPGLDETAEQIADRLAPGEQLPGVETTFGVEVPPGMRVSARFPDVVQLQGRLHLDHLVRYYQKHLLVTGVELSQDRAEFRRAHVKGDPDKRLYRVVITQKNKHSVVRISDVTPPPKVQGLDQAERWERAGMRSDGTLKDRLNVY